MFSPLIVLTIFYSRVRTSVPEITNEPGRRIEKQHNR